MSPTLECGCGTGNASLFFAARGLQVTGVDFVEEAVLKARAKAVERGLSVEFLVKDAMAFSEWDKRFASVIDSGLFHIYYGEDQQRYVRGLSQVLKPGGRLFLFSFSDKMESLGVGGFSRQELHDIFASGWEMESLDLVRGEVNPVFLAQNPEWNPNRGEPKTWFALIRRKE